MKSCIYTGRVGHGRHHPNPHSFSYRVFMLYLDLGELETVFSSNQLWSFNRHNIASFLESDHYLEEGFSLSDSIRRLIKNRTGKNHTGPVCLLTHLRYFGYIMNPVSFYYCWDDAGKQLEFIVAEIHNTPWGERHCYVLDVSAQEPDEPIQFRFRKNFHVSPFMPMEQDYEWKFNLPDELLSVRMSNYEAGSRIFDAWCHMQREALTPASLNRKLVTYPVMTLKVITAIYWQAFRIWLKKIPFYEHPRHLMNRGKIS